MQDSWGGGREACKGWGHSIVEQHLLCMDKIPGLVPGSTSKNLLQVKSWTTTISQCKVKPDEPMVWICDRQLSTYLAFPKVQQSSHLNMPITCVNTGELSPTGGLLSYNRWMSSQAFLIALLTLPDKKNMLKMETGAYLTTGMKELRAAQAQHFILAFRLTTSRLNEAYYKQKEIRCPKEIAHIKEELN